MSTSDQYAREQTARSMDTIAIQNQMSEDVIFWTDKYGTQSSKTLVPGKDKDIGFGKGIAHMMRWKAERFTEDHITRLINEYSDAKWLKDSKVYRTRDEKLAHAESEQIRTNDATLWGNWFPKIWLGVVEKFGMLDLPEPIDESPIHTGSALGDALQKTGMADKPYEPQA